MLGGGLEFADQAAPFADDVALENRQSLDLSLVLPVVAEVVVGKTVGGAGGCLAGADEVEGNNPGEIGLQREAGNIHHAAEMRGVLTESGVAQRRDAGIWLGLAGVGLGLFHPHLQLAHAREVLVEFIAIGGADVALKLPGLAGDAVEDRLALADAGDLCGDLRASAVDEEAGKHARGARLGRYGHAAGGVAAAVVSARGKIQRSEAGRTADPRGGELVE